MDPKTIESLPFLTPAIWMAEAPTLFETVQSFLYTTSDLYFSSLYFSSNPHPRFAINGSTGGAHPFLPSTKIDQYKIVHWRLATGCCLALAAAQGAASLAVRIWKEKAPAFLHCIQQTPSSLLGRTFHSLIWAGVVTALLFTAIKIVIRLSYNIVVIEAPQKPSQAPHIPPIPSTPSNKETPESRDCNKNTPTASPKQLESKQISAGDRRNYLIEQITKDLPKELLQQSFLGPLSELPEDQLRKWLTIHYQVKQNKLEEAEAVKQWLAILPPKQVQRKFPKLNIF